ncbi:MAG: DDE-type integrase/transposase/recombinase [Deltaproteobacteria bacterium]|nr:DDE-type integrase/transposase/recombinase [Deltaproteobacteria bacterium]
MSADLSKPTNHRRNIRNKGYGDFGRISARSNECIISTCAETRKSIPSASTWHKLIKERGWRRPRKRLHPAKPKVGIRTERPDEKWHIDTSVIKLLDGTKAYIHGVIDNHSRRILSWLVTDHFDIQSTIKILLEATQASLSPDIRHSFIYDSGVENINDSVNELLRKGFLKRILACVELDFSNSMIESF